MKTFILYFTLIIYSAVSSTSGITFDLGNGTVPENISADDAGQVVSAIIEGDGISPWLSEGLVYDEETLPDDFDWSAYKNSKYKKNLGKAVIIIPKKATPEEKLAAEIVQLAIGTVDGPVYDYYPEIITDAKKRGSTGLREISIGNTNRPHGKAKYSSAGSYSIKAYKNGVSITGVGKRGTIDGAVHFAELCGGIFWLSWEDGMKTNQDCFKYSSSISYDYERYFEFTDSDLNFWQTVTTATDNNGKTQPDYLTNRLYSLYFGLNGVYPNVETKTQPGGQNWYLSKGGNYGYLQPGHCHTLLAEYFTEKDYEKHPEWFVRDSASSPWNTYQLCLSNPGVYDHIEKQVFQLLDDPDIYDPSAEKQIISLTQSDSATRCFCKECSKFRREHTWKVCELVNDDWDGEAALYLNLVNKISKAIKARGKKKGISYDNVYVDMLAYTQTEYPPSDMEIDDHVIIRFAPIARCYSHDLCEDAEKGTCWRNYEFGSALKGWSELVKKSNATLWIWDYNTNFTSSLAPYMNLISSVRDIRGYYEDYGVSGIYLQGTDRLNKTDTEYGDLRYYVQGVLLRDPYANPWNEARFFAHEFWGRSGRYILETVEILTEQAQNHYAGPNCTYPYEKNPDVCNRYFRDLVCTYNAPISRIVANNYNGNETRMDAHNRMTDKKIGKLEGLWKKAVKAAAKDTERHQFTTERTRLSWRIIKSTLKALEFSKPSEYLKRNYELYDDLFDKFHISDYRLTNPSERRIPVRSDDVLCKIPEKWL